MEADRLHKLQDDRSDCRSLGSNYHPSSQSRKISIGITTDSLGIGRSGAAKKDEIIKSNAERDNANQENSKGKGVAEATEGKQIEPPEKVASPWITTKSFHQNPPTSNIFVSGKQTSNFPATRGRRSKLIRPQDTKIAHSQQLIDNQLSGLHSGDGKQKNFKGFTYKRKGSKDGNSQNSEEFSFGRSKLSRPQDTKIAHSEQLFENRVLGLHSGDCKQKNFKGLTYKRKGSKDGNSQNAEESTFVTKHEVLVSDKAATRNEKEDRTTETLRIKLWEILGTVSSPRSQPSNFQARDEGANNLTHEKIHHQKGDAVAKPMHNSDTIETDSENPDHTMKRPVTHPLTRNRATSKAQPVKAKTGLSFSYGNNLRGKNILSFEEGLLGKGDVAVSGGSSMPARKKGTRKNSGIEPRKIQFNEDNNTKEIDGGNCRSETPPPAGKASSHSDKMGSVNGCSFQTKDEYLKQKNGNKGDSHQSPRKDPHHSAGENRVDQQRDVSSRSVPENEGQQEGFGQPSLKNFMDPQDEFQSPTFKINTPMLSCSPGSTPKTVQMKQKVYSPRPADRRFTLEKICGFKNLKTSNADCHVPNAETGSSDDDVELEVSPPHKPLPVKGGKEVVEDGLSESSEYEDSIFSDKDSMAASTIFKKLSSSISDLISSDQKAPNFIQASSYNAEVGAFSPEIAKDARSNFVLYPSKRLRNLEGKSVRKCSPTLPSAKGIGESDWNLEPSGQNRENELERVITLFALALENFKNNMKKATRKKSSEILMSVSEEIHLQLQNVASKIQTDAGELTNICKSKRKQLETRFQEQQEKLRLIQDKFIQDIQQHLQDCENTVEELAMHHIELKGTMKKQKASHQKLITQVEETVETQLGDAERRIRAVHKSATQKMLRMLQVIAECLFEGNLS